MRLRRFAWLCLPLAWGIAPFQGANAAEGRSESGLPAAVADAVDFARDIKPILESSCLNCHAHGQKKGGYQIDSRELFLKGGESGPAAAVGRSAESLVVRLVAGLDPERVMPAKGPRLAPRQVALLRGWIDQGLPWPDSVKLGRVAEARLEPRRVELPRGRGAGTNPVDRLLAPYFAAQGIKPSKPVPDAVFARRASLDVIGLLPTPGALAAFEADRRKDKRTRLVLDLLGDREGYATHWMTFWNDALRNDYRGTGFIDGGRKQITPWLYAALATNMSFDRFVARLVNPDEHAEGFTKGIVWRGVVNASQTPPIQAAQNISQVFLGINLKCASCHDSFISNWKLGDAYGLASVYADTPLELVRCDKPTGEIAQRKFLYPQLGGVADSTNKAERLASLARLVTDPGNGRLTRTVVNRLWARFMGRGLIEPVDEMDGRPWNADLLDWLALDLADHGYDLKRTMALILTSRAYQLPAVGGAEQIADTFVFQGPVVKRLSAEQYLDALSALTGLWHEQPANLDVYQGLDPAGGLDSRTSARWIWTSGDALKGVPPQTAFFRNEFQVDTLPVRAFAVISADNRFKLFINGTEAGAGDDWNQPRTIEVQKHLVKGRNVVAVLAVNGAGQPGDTNANPAGLLVEAFAAWPAPSGGASSRSADRPVRGGGVDAPGRTETRLLFASDRSWRCATNEVAGWQRADFAAEGWASAAELGDAASAPWKLDRAFVQARVRVSRSGPVRAALVNADPLQTALGRPNREQVVTSRSPVATTLQALELTNGATLADWLRRGAERLLNEAPGQPADLVRRLYRHGLGRGPTEAELALAAEAVGTPPAPEGMQDFLWSLSLLPEFQLIY